MHKRPSFLGALVVLVVVAGLLVWWVNSLPNGDALWFWRSFTAKPDWMVVYWDGTTTMLFPGDPGYDEIFAAFAAGVAHWTGYEGGVGLSDENLERYRNEWRLLEVCYNTPVQVHTRHLYSKARKFYVPLSGTHANWHRVFAGLVDRPRIGVLNMSAARYARLLEVVETYTGSPQVTE